MAIALTLAMPLVGHAQEPQAVPLAPASAWVVDYADDSCALQRAFGEEGQRVQLEIRKFGHGNDMQVIVASADFASRTGDYSVQFVPLDQQPRSMEGLLNLDYGDGLRGRLFMYSLAAADEEASAIYKQFVRTTPVLLDEQRLLVLEAIDLSSRVFGAQSDPGSSDRRNYDNLLRTQTYQDAARTAFGAFIQTDIYRQILDRQEALVAGIALDSAFTQPLFLQTGSLDLAMDAMDTCLDELMSHWGVDVEAHRELTRAVEPLDYARLVREIQEDYPPRMVARRMPGVLRVRLNVSAEGMPTQCHIQSPISDDSFEQVACAKMMRHARFQPALDAAGQPIASYFQSSIVYAIGN